MNVLDGFRINRILEYSRILNLHSVILDCNADGDVIAFPHTKTGITISDSSVQTNNYPMG